ncbi:MAG: peptidoglycan editing factor PgeF [Steroidobacteraceae bacterium]
MIEIITPDWPVAANVRACSSTRLGGVSVAPFDSLNLGQRSGDAAEAVAHNVHRFSTAARLPAEPMWLTQVHGTDVAVLDAMPVARDADAAITRRTRTVCAIQSADCLPVLFAARDGSCVGAAHAGWRGLAGGVLENTIAALDVAPHDLLAWLGPAIGPASFEVGEEVRAAFTAQAAIAATAFERNTRARWRCDLYALARQRLTAAGVTQVHGGGLCTYADSRRFYSYRRDGRTGRMATLIWLD